MGGGQIKDDRLSSVRLGLRLVFGYLLDDLNRGVDRGLGKGYNRSMEKRSFVSPSKGKLTLGEVIGEITAYLEEEPERQYRLIIGTDSHNSTKDHRADFVTAVVIHRIGRGGRYFWSKKKRANIVTLRDKIYTETLLSLDLAQKLVPKLQAYLKPGNGGYELEIHIDVGEIGPTREMIREVVGMVVGNGFKAKTKPDSYGASTVADRYT